MSTLALFFLLFYFLFYTPKQREHNPWAVPAVDAKAEEKEEEEEERRVANAAEKATERKKKRMQFVLLRLID